MLDRPKAVSSLFDADEIARTLNIVAPDGQVVEVRVLDG